MKKTKWLELPRWVARGLCKTAVRMTLRLHGWKRVRVPDTTPPDGLPVMLRWRRTEGNITYTLTATNALARTFANDAG